VPTNLFGGHSSVGLGAASRVGVSLNVHLNGVGASAALVGGKLKCTSEWCGGAGVRQADACNCATLFGCPGRQKSTAAPLIHGLVLRQLVPISHFTLIVVPV
jgi:hypothetical protein